MWINPLTQKKSYRNLSSLLLGHIAVTCLDLTSFFFWAVFVHFLRVCVDLVLWAHFDTLKGMPWNMTAWSQWAEDYLLEVGDSTATPQWRGHLAVFAPTLLLCKMSLFSEDGTDCVRLSLYLIKGEITFWWDWDLKLVFHQISLNGISHGICDTPLPSNPLISSAHLNSEASLSERIFVAWGKYILLFSAQHKAMLMCIWYNRESM